MCTAASRSHRTRQWAVHASAMFLMLGAGVSSLRSDIGLMALFASNAAGGLSIRRLLPAAVFVPLLVGALTLYGDRNGWFGTYAALTLFAFTSVIVFAALVWINAAMLERADLQGQRAQRALSASEDSGWHCDRRVLPRRRQSHGRRGSNSHLEALLGLPSFIERR